MATRANNTGSHFTISPMIKYLSLPITILVFLRLSLLTSLLFFLPQAFTERMGLGFFA